MVPPGVNGLGVSKHCVITAPHALQYLSVSFVCGRKVRGYTNSSENIGQRVILKEIYPIYPCGHPI